jgi:hypothetical protein
MDEGTGLVILEDAPLEGMASVVERLGDADDEAASLALEQHLDQQEVGKAGDRGIMRNLVEQFRGMSQVADLGTHPTRLEWLAFHVPPGGTGQLQLEVAGTRHAAVQLKVMGLGGGSGRTFTFGAERDLGTRDQCFALGAWIDVRLRTFRGRDADASEELRVDVVAVTNSYIEPLRPCALCFTEASRRPPRARPTGSGWDLTSDDKGLTERLTVEFTRESEMEVILQIPGLPLGELVPGVAINREVRSRCEALYTFPGGANFVGYELIGRRKDFPFWGRS